MGQDLNIKTSLSVHELALILSSNDNIINLCEIDSINYGIGYDFKVKDIECRLYEESSDNEDSLIIEIDRFNKQTIIEQKKVYVLLDQLIFDLITNH